MRRAILLGLILAPALGTSSAQRVSVQQLERLLASAPPSEAANPAKMDLMDQVKREEALAPRLGTLELTERLTGQSRARLVAKYKLGPVTRGALELLADRSALLDPPAGEIPNLPPPDDQVQKAMMRQAGEFVFETLKHLPDFFALLTTTQFDDGPTVANGEILAADPGMHLVGSSEREITFSEGREVFDSSRVSLTSRQPRGEGLESQGEFGAEAAIVFLDLPHGTLAFHHWESTAQGTVAVYRYAVPVEQSHYEVKYACHGLPGFHAQPAYHGTLSIDPATGVLARFTVQTESAPDDPITQVASVIDYGAVVLGDRRYFCPVRSLSFTVEEADTCTNARKRRLTRPVSMLNRIIFTDYHRLGTEMVIVPGAQPADTPAQGPGTAKPAQTTTPQTATPAPTVPPSR